MSKTNHLRCALAAACLFIGGWMTSAVAQQRTITGVVTDDQGPMVGVTVMIKGTTVGAFTGPDGGYSIMAAPEDVLVFSSVGYVTEEVKPGQSTLVNVFMRIESTLLDDVVVVGYGTQAKSHLTGSISKLEGAALIDNPVSDVTTALQGQVAGLSISNTTSEVGVTPSIRVRGTGSISADSSPLVVIDGFPVPEGLSTLNASDIRSIEILKDAASAAIYGSRAANGVIMVTTKSGDAAKPQYSVKFYQGVKYAYQLHDLLTATEYLRLQEYEESVGGNAVKGQDRAAAWIESNIGSTDWQREALRDFTGITNVQFAVSSGTKAMRQYTSASYTRDQGLMYQNEVKKLQFRTRMDLDLGRAVKFGYNISGNYSRSERPRNNYIDFYRTPSFLPVYHNEWTTALTGGYTGFARGSHFNSITTPTGDPDDYGNPGWDRNVSPFNSANNNPKSVMANTERWSETMSGLGNAYIEVTLAKGLTFKSSNGFNIRYSPSYTYANQNAIRDGTPSEATFYSTLYVDLLTENTLNYKLTLGEHKLDLLAGYTAEKTRVQRVALTGTGFATDDIHTLNAATVFELASANNGNNAGTGTFRYPDKILESALARASYSYKDRYLLSASIRLDRSSLFLGDNVNAWFPSVSLGWRVSEEPWMKGQRTLSNLKFRASYGVTGNNSIDYFSALEVLGNANYVTGTGNGSLVSGAANTSTTLANPDITWEQTDEVNAGLDLGLFRGRISLTADAYWSITRALLFEQPTQSFTGFTNYWNNIGRVRNAGIELQLSTVNLEGPLSWTTDINFSLARNKLLEIGGERQVITQGERNEAYIARVGEPLIQYYGYKTSGIWNSTEEINANPHFAADVPGGLRIVDTNGDGVLSDDDRVALGDPYPDFSYGMTNTLRWREWDFSFLIQGVQGVTLYNGDAFYNETHKYNASYVKNRWVSESHQGDGKTPYAKVGYDLMLTDYPLQDGSYMCLRNATIGYTFDRKRLSGSPVKGLRLYLAGNNLLYIWSKDYLGINPESRMTSGDYSSPMISGYQRGGFPLTSTVTFGVELKFK